MTQWVKDTAKNLTDFNCDWNPIYRAAAPPETCHQVAEHIGNEAGKLADNPAGYVAKKALDGTINQILTNFWEGAVGAYKQFITSWLHAGPIINPETSSAFQWGTGIVNIFTALAVTIGILWAGIRIVWSQRGEDIRYVFASLARVVVVSGLGVTVFALLLTASDQAAAAILDSTAWGQKDTMAVLGDPGKAVSALGAMLFVLGNVMLLVVIIQWCIMIFVSIAIPVLLMYWPVAEGMVFASGGRGFSRVSKWLVAFILFKPTVAVLYGFAFEELKGGDSLGGAITAICILMLGPFALPALLKIVNPAATGTGADGAGAALTGLAGFAMGAVGVAAGAATGGASVQTRPRLQRAAHLLAHPVQTQHLHLHPHRPQPLGLKPLLRHPPRPPNHQQTPVAHPPRKHRRLPLIPVHQAAVAVPVLQAWRSWPRITCPPHRRLKRPCSMSRASTECIKRPNQAPQGAVTA